MLWRPCPIRQTYRQYWSTMAPLTPGIAKATPAGLQQDSPQPTWNALSGRLYARYNSASCPRPFGFHPRFQRCVGWERSCQRHDIQPPPRHAAYTSLSGSRRSTMASTSATLASSAKATSRNKPLSKSSDAVWVDFTGLILDSDLDSSPGDVHFFGRRRLAATVGCLTAAGLAHTMHDAPQPPP